MLISIQTVRKPILLFEHMEKPLLVLPTYVCFSRSYDEYRILPGGKLAVGNSHVTVMTVACPPWGVQSCVAVGSFWQ